MGSSEQADATFYESLGWRVDADLMIGEGQRVIQITPTHSNCSIHFGDGLTKAEPGAADRLIIGEVEGPEDPDQRSYFTTAEFSDPDGKGRVLQEVTTRLPGRERED